MKTYKKEDIKDFKREHKEEIKILNEIWKKENLGNPLKIGYIIDIIEKIKPESFENFVEKGTEEIGSVKLNGIFIILKNLIREKEINILDTKEQNTIEIIYKFIFMRIFYESYVGYVGENLFKEKCENILEIRSVEKTTKEIDHEYGIDFIVTTQNGKRIGVQVKPLSFLYSCIYNVSVMNCCRRKMESGLVILSLNKTCIVLVDDNNLSTTSWEDFLHLVRKCQRGNE